MRLGWIFLFKSVSAASNKAPANITTDVVPSPASISYALDVYINNLALGCNTDKFFIIVAPSLVTITSPLEVSRSLSIPFGPREVLIISAIAFAANIFDYRTSSDLYFLSYNSPVYAYVFYT